MFESPIADYLSLRVFVIHWLQAALLASSLAAMKSALETRSAGWRPIAAFPDDQLLEICRSVRDQGV